MKGHALPDLDERQKAFEEHRGEIQGRIPKGPFEFDESLDFDGEALKVAPADPAVVARLKLAVRRDARYSVASGPYMHLFGLSQNLRSIYDGAGQLQDGGAG